MAAMVIAIAEAVVAELKAGPFSGHLEPIRAYRPAFDLEELKDLRVSVVPKSLVIESASRHSNQYDVSVDVAVQKRTSDLGELDGLMALVQEIADHLRLQRLAGYPQACWQRTANVPIYSPEHLEGKQVFTSVLTVTYRVVR